MSARPGLWAITSYFNPAGYRRKLVNYRAFRERLDVPLVAVEQGFDGCFELEAGDADILVRVQGGAVLWQKERLLDLGRQVLPPDCETVAWLDCDVVFDAPDWAELARAALERLDLVHLFHERHNLPPDEPLDRLGSWSVPPTRSLVHLLDLGMAEPDELKLGSTAGLGWAMRREALDRHGFYDACILGGGDRVMLNAAYGRFDLGRRAQRMNARRAEHYLAWARPFFNTVRGRVGSIPGRLFHLWHGDLRDRRYEARFALLEHFDPFTDIALDAGGCWRWASAKADLHEAIRRYFEERNEDGVEPALAPGGAVVARTAG